MLPRKQQARAMIRFLLLLPVLLAPLLAAAQPAQRHMVAAGHPLAVEAGLGVLRDGGSALDAAVAVQAVLTLVEPQSSGIGGGAFIMFRRAADGEVLRSARALPATSPPIRCCCAGTLVPAPISSPPMA